MGKRSYRASTAGVEKLSLAFDQTGLIKQENIGCLLPRETTIPTRQTISKFFNGKPVSKEIFITLCDALKLQWKDVAELESEKDETFISIGSSMNTPINTSTSESNLMGAIATVEQANKKTHITFDTINGQFIITIPGDINNLFNNDKKRNDLLKAVKVLSGDENAMIAKIEKGSIKITFNVSPDGIKKLEAEPDKIILVARIISRDKGERLDLSDIDLSGVDLSGVDLSRINFSCADLSGANLQDANLENADLDCADLSGANLRGANLRRASLNNSIIDDKWLTVIDDKWLTVWKIVNQLSVDKKFTVLQKLVRADLSGADLSGADLSNTDLSSADLSSANLIGANLSNAGLSSANLSGALLMVANLRNADLRNADLRNADLTGANLSSANLIGANLSGADLSSADLIGARLRVANLSGARLRNAILFRAYLSGAILFRADLSGADLRNADLRNANLINADLRNADLFRADLFRADLSGATVKNARFGETSGITENIKRELKQRGAIFEDSPDDGSKVFTR